MKTIDAARLLAVALVAAVFLPSSDDAGAYHHDIENGTATAWRTASPSAIWNDTTKTLTWHFNQLSFPQGTWPTIAQAGAAFENRSEEHTSELQSQSNLV